MRFKEFLSEKLKLDSATQANRIARFQAILKTDETTAREYLEAEEWDLSDAIKSYRADTLGTHKKV